MQRIQRPVACSSPTLRGAEKSSFQGWCRTLAQRHREGDPGRELLDQLAPIFGDPAENFPIESFARHTLSFVGQAPAYNRGEVPAAATRGRSGPSRSPV